MDMYERCRVSARQWHELDASRARKDSRPLFQTAGKVSFLSTKIGNSTLLGWRVIVSLTQGYSGLLSLTNYLHLVAVPATEAGKDALKERRPNR